MAKKKSNVEKINGIRIYAKYDELVDPATLIDYKKNRNKHPEEQIKKLAMLYKKVGVTHPITVSKLSGAIAFGHARKLAAIEAGLKLFPVVYHEYETAEQEYAAVQSDNVISSYGELDILGMKKDILEFKEFDIESLALKDFQLNIGEKFEEPTVNVEGFTAKIKGDSRNVILAFVPEEYEEFVSLSDRLKEHMEEDSLTDLVLRVFRDYLFKVTSQE